MKWSLPASALCAILVGIGLGRFIYTPLVPALISAGWFTPAQVAFFGAANFFGYFAGALSAQWFARHYAAAPVLRGMMLISCLALAACAFPLSPGWYFGWRFASGFSGGTLMVLTATTVLSHVPVAQRGLASGITFSGVGIGIIATGTVIPLLLQIGLAETWLIAAALALVLTALTWRAWPESGEVRAALDTSGAVPKPHRRALWLLYATYGLCAVGLVPHMLFLSDYIARGMGAGIAAGGYYWALFGCGAAGGALLTGIVADRIGFRRGLQLSLMVQAVCVVLILIPWPPATIVSTLAVGSFVPGVVPLVLGRIHELTGEDAVARVQAWSRATMAFAFGQAAAAFGYSAIYAALPLHGYAVIFCLGAAAFMLGLAIEIASRTPAPSPRRVS